MVRSSALMEAESAPMPLIVKSDGLMLRRVDGQRVGQGELGGGRAGDGRAQGRGLGDDAGPVLELDQIGDEVVELGRADAGGQVVSGRRGVSVAAGGDVVEVGCCNWGWCRPGRGPTGTAEWSHRSSGRPARTRPWLATATKPAQVGDDQLVPSTTTQPP